MTTSSSTSLTSRSDQLRRSMRRVPPFTDRVLIGVGRSNTRPLACVSVTITFRTRPAARKCSGRDPPRHLRVQPASLPPGGVPTVPLRPTPVRDHSPARVRHRPMPSPSSCAIESSPSAARTLRSARDVVVCNEIRTAIGILAKHRLQYYEERHREQQVQLLKKRAAKLGLQIIEPAAA